MTIGTEWDYVKRDEPSTPANLVMLSSQVIPLASQAAVYNGSTYLNNGVFNYGLSLYRANSGALVFNTGSWRFTFGLARLRNNQIDLSGPVDPIMQQGAINLLCDMGISSGTLMGVVQNGNPTLLVAPGSPAPAAAYGLTMTPSHYQTILKPEQEPIVRNAADGNDYTLATVFTSSVDGNMHGVRWYFSDTLPSQQVIGLLFSWGSETTGVELARVAFSNIQTGWCEALFSAPVAITANTKYVVAVWTRMP